MIKSSNNQIDTQEIIKDLDEKICHILYLTFGEPFWFRKYEPGTKIDKDNFLITFASSNYKVLLHWINNLDYYQGDFQIIGEDVDSTKQSFSSSLSLDDFISQFSKTLSSWTKNGFIESARQIQSGFKEFILSPDLWKIISFVAFELGINLSFRDAYRYLKKNPKYLENIIKAKDTGKVAEMKQAAKDFVKKIFSSRQIKSGYTPIDPRLFDTMKKYNDIIVESIENGSLNRETPKENIENTIYEVQVAYPNDKIDEDKLRWYVSRKVYEKYYTEMEADDYLYTSGPIESSRQIKSALSKDEIIEKLNNIYYEIYDIAKEEGDEALYQALYDLDTIYDEKDIAEKGWQLEWIVRNAGWSDKADLIHNLRINSSRQITSAKSEEEFEDVIIQVEDILGVNVEHSNIFNLNSEMDEDTEYEIDDICRQYNCKFIPVNGSRRQYRLIQSSRRIQSMKTPKNVYLNEDTQKLIQRLEKRVGHELKLKFEEGNTPYVEIEKLPKGGYSFITKNYLNNLAEHFLYDGYKEKQDSFIVYLDPAIMYTKPGIKSAYTREDYDRFDENGEFIPYKPTEEELAKKDEIKTVLKQELSDAYEPDPMDDYVGYDSTNERIDMACERVAKQFGVDTDFVEDIAGEIDRENIARSQAEPEYVYQHCKDKDKFWDWYNGEDVSLEELGIDKAQMNKEVDEVVRKYVNSSRQIKSSTVTSDKQFRLIDTEHNDPKDGEDFTEEELRNYISKNDKYFDNVGLDYTIVDLNTGEEMNMSTFRLNSSCQIKSALTQKQKNYVLNYLKENSFFPCDNGKNFYFLVPVDDKHIKMTPGFKKQLKEEGLYGNSFIGGMTDKAELPIDMMWLPIYGDANRWVTKWFTYSYNSCFDRDLRDRGRALSKRLDLNNINSSKKPIKSSIITPWDTNQVTGTSDEDLGLSAVVDIYGNEFVNVDESTLNELKDTLVRYFDDEAYVRDWNINNPDYQIEDAFEVTDPEEMSAEDLARYFDYEAYGRDIRLEDNMVWDSENQYWISAHDVGDEELNNDKYIFMRG